MMTKSTIVCGKLDDEIIPNDINSYLGRVIHICCRWKHSWYDLPSDGKRGHLDDALQYFNQALEIER